MIKTIQIGGQPVEINSSAGWLYIYSEQFGHDILSDLMPMLEGGIKALTKIFDFSTDEIETGDILGNIDDEVIEDLMITLSPLKSTTLTDITWSLAKNAKSDLPEPRVWINEFESFYIDDIGAEVIKAVLESSISKKKYEKLAKLMKTLRQSLSKESPSQESTED